MAVVLAETAHRWSGHPVERAERDVVVGKEGMMRSPSLGDCY